MTQNSSRAPQRWDDIFYHRGHTGYTESRLYAYDQPLRLRALQRTLLRLYPNGLHGMKALDVGCGTGDIIGELRRLGATVIGLDLSREVIKAARARDCNSEEVDFALAAVEALPVRQGTLHLITSITVLQHVIGEDLVSSTIRQLFDALKDNGRMLVLEIAPNTLDCEDGTANILVERTTATWRRLFLESGFTIEDELVYAPFGPMFLQQSDRAIGKLLRLFRRRKRGSIDPSTDSETLGSAPGASPLRATLRNARRMLRQSLLYVAWPLDYLLHVQGPHRWAYYRFFILRPGRK